MAAVLQHQGVDDSSGVEPRRGWNAVVPRPGRRPHPGIRGAWQGRDHAVPAGDPPGRFPSANVSRDSWADHARMRAEVCEFQPEWPAGAKLPYHRRSAPLTLSMVIEGVTRSD